jgi:adenosylmethionine-8-amino-7-oxononanoate aminotransferase
MKELVPYSIPKKSDSYIIDSYTDFGFIIDGKEYIDCISNRWEFCLGFKQDKIADFICDNIKKYPAVKFNYTNKYVEKLNEQLFNITNKQFVSVHYAGSGSDSVENAIKLSRIYNKRKYVISFIGSWHGSTELTASITGSKMFHKNVPTYEYSIKVPQPVDDDVQPLLDAIESVGAENVSCIIKEPFSVQTSSVVASKEYYDKVRKICDDNNIVFIVDEVATGIGRTGEWYGYQRIGMKPDIVVTGKSLTAGYSMLSAILINQKIYDQVSGSYLNMGFTHSPHMNGILAAIKTIETIKEENILDNVYEIEDTVKQIFPESNESTAVGCYFSYKLNSNKDSGDIYNKMYEQGYICSRSVFGDPAIRFLFPNNMPLNMVDTSMKTLRQIIDDYK